MDESFIGGFRHQHPPSPRPPALPPKDFPYSLHPQNAFMPQPPRPAISTSQLTHMTAVERSQTLRVVRMEPHLQVFSSRCVYLKLAI
jgi:hypothetical protein